MEHLRRSWDTVMNNSMFYGYGNLLLVYLMLIILLKVFASSATNGGGGCGGIFAPSLYFGNIAGFVFLILAMTLLSPLICRKRILP